MSRTVIDLDDEALEAARAELGTSTKVETVNTALREIAARKERARRVREAKYLFGDPEGMADPGFMEMVRPGYTARQELGRQRAAAAAAAEGE